MSDGILCVGAKRRDKVFLAQGAGGLAWLPKLAQVAQCGARQHSGVAAPGCLDPKPALPLQLCMVARVQCSVCLARHHGLPTPIPPWTPPHPGQQQLQELCSFLEEQMGLPVGWLLRVPLTLLLYVSAARRIQAVVAAEAIKEAYPVKPALPPGVALSMLSVGSATPAAPAIGDERQPAGPGATAAAAAAAPAGVGHAAAVAEVATSGRSLLSVTLSSGGGATAGPAECDAGGDDGCAAQSGNPTPARQQHQLLQQPQEEERQQQQQRQQAGPQQEERGPQRLQEQRQQTAPQPAGQAAQQAPQQAPQQAQQTAPLALDRSRRVRAACGVRLMWVSLEARRRGLATRLLDCCRAQATPGYVVPRHELAFRCAAGHGGAPLKLRQGRGTRENANKLVAAPGSLHMRRACPRCGLAALPPRCMLPPLCSKDATTITVQCAHR